MKVVRRGWFVAVVCCLLVWTSVSYSMEAPDVSTTEAVDEVYPNHGIMVNPLSILLGFALGVANVSIQYDHAFTDWVGLSVAPSFAYVRVEDVTAYGGGLEIGPRILLSGDKLDGFFLLPAFLFFYVTGEDDDDNSKASGGVIGGALDFGYEWTWAPGFALSLQGGLAYYNFVGDLDRLDGDRIPIFPRLALLLGYAW